MSQLNLSALSVYTWKCPYTPIHISIWWDRTQNGVSWQNSHRTVKLELNWEQLANKWAPVSYFFLLLYFHYRYVCPLGELHTTFRESAIFLQTKQLHCGGKYPAFVGFFLGNWTIMEKYWLGWILIQLSDLGFLFKELSDYPSIEIVKQPDLTVNKVKRCWGG